jgi:peptidoglycan/xylan/chitin deacetylase (PgdA/CDA1 family)
MTSRRERVAWALQTTGLLPLLRTFPGWKGLLVVNYHRIGNPGASPLDRGAFSGTAEALNAQIAILKREADIILPADLEAAREKPGRYVMLTFDDGYRDNYELAFPILKAHGVGAVFFPCTSFIDRAALAWWDEIAWMVRSSPRQGLPANPWLRQALDFDEPGRERAIRLILSRYKELPATIAGEFIAFLAEATGSGRADPTLATDLWMTWGMVREMHAAGMEIGGHTVNHPILARLNPDQQQVEISGCRQRLTSELGAAPRAFAYPVGGRDAFDSSTQSILCAEGFQYAFSFYGGYSRFNRHRPWHPLDIPRVAVSHDAGLATIKALVSFPQLVAAPVPALLRKTTSQPEAMSQPSLS